MKILYNEPFKSPAQEAAFNDVLAVLSNADFDVELYFDADFTGVVDESGAPKPKPRPKK